MSFKTSIEKIILNLTDKFRYFGSYRYRVSSDVLNKIEANIVSKTDEMPDIQGVERAHGIPGLTSVVQQDQQVLIAYENGNPSRPIVIGFYSGVPMSLEFKMVNQAEFIKNLNLTPGVFVALSDPTIARLESINSIVQSLNTWIQTASTIIEPLLPPPAQAAFHTLIELIDSQADAADTSVTTASQNYPVGIKSTALKAN